MTNIYSFLYYTFSLSFLALFILIVKRLFLDKLSPRWQYGIWGVLALRAVVPLNGNGKELTAFLLQLIEFIKQLVEPSLDSAYTSLNTVTKVLFLLPIQTRLPASLTDWLFVVYLFGVILTLLWYTISYLRLKSLLKKGRKPSVALQEKLETVCKAYNLSSCDVLETSGLPSAMICGVFHPILAVPAGSDPQEAVVLHELLHLRYKDALQNLLWSLFKALNWCNPFLRYICRQIGNDLETLCDQRVLERLEGEARREYGLTLLSMANEKYARAPGTTSLSNGGAFIAKRIEAIARFKRYPQGMSLVSFCLCIVLAVAFLFGNSAPYTLYDSPKYQFGGKAQQALALSSARLYRCSTLAGALDVYAKGLINENKLHIVAASPLETQETIFYSETIPWLTENDWQYDGFGEGYQIYNLCNQADGSFVGEIIYKVGPGQNDPPPPDNAKQEWYAVYPIRASQNDGRWSVVQRETPYRQEVLANDLYDLPWSTEYRAEGQSGTVSVFVQLRTSVENSGDKDFWGNARFDNSLKPNAQFNSILVMNRQVYTCIEKRDGLTHVGLKLQSRNSEQETVSFPESIAVQNDMTSSSNNGSASLTKNTDSRWDGILQGGHGSGYSGTDIEDGDFRDYLPYDFVVRVYWNGHAVEDLYLKEVQ